MNQPDPVKENSKGERLPGKIIPFKRIRQETVLSKLPVHNLSKMRSISIHIERRGKDGKIDLFWHVSPSRDYPEPGQLAYKLDTLVINRRIEQHPRPLPKIIKLGSLRTLAKQLGLSRWKTDTNAIKNALHQNAGAYIRAKIYYTTRDGKQKYIEPSDTRYGLIFTGERLPSGEKADAVYVVLHDFFREIWDDAPRRPLNDEYLKQLLKRSTSTARFYELISYRFYAFFKFNHPHAKMRYSDYCRDAPQKRNYQRWQVKHQMKRIHQVHIESGYLAKVWYEDTTDDAGTPDWFMFYIPGPKARDEYTTFTGKKLPESPAAQEQTPQPIEDQTQPPVTKQGTASNPVADRLINKWAFTPADAAELLSKLAPDQPTAEQLAYWESVIERQGIGTEPGQIRSGSGLIESKLRENAPVPDHFQSPAKRQAEKEKIETRQAAAEQLRRDYESYLRQRALNHIEQNTLENEYAVRMDTKLKSLRKLMPKKTDQELHPIAHPWVLDQFVKDLPDLKTFDAWRADQQQPAAEAAG